MSDIIAHIPGLGPVKTDTSLISLDECSDGVFKKGFNGVTAIFATGDRKVEFIAFTDHTIVYVNSAMDYPAYYPLHPVQLERPIKAVLMDLDGTSVRSEEFWIWIIQMTTASLLDNPRFELEEAEHTHREMQAIMGGHGRENAFVPTPGLKEFLLNLKDMGLKIGLVTSGLYEKAWPEILSAFRSLDMGDPKDFYDAIITAGFPLRKGESGTLGELSPKPHPWLYAETCRVGLGIEFADRNAVLGMEDSGAGVCSLRLAGYPTVGVAGGNIIESGTQELCNYYCYNFEEVLTIIKNY